MERKKCFPWEFGKEDFNKIDTKDVFLKELVKIWADFNYRDSFLLNPAIQDV